MAKLDRDARTAGAGVLCGCARDFGRVDGRGRPRHLGKRRQCCADARQQQERGESDRHQPGGFEPTAL